MRKLVLLLWVGLFSIALVGADAEARRLGGGKSLGRQSPSYSRQVTPPPAPAVAPRQSSAQQTVANTGARRWLGPLAGLAVGGLLASLLFGGGFEGFRILDFLLLAALVYGGFLLFRAIRGRTAASAAGAGRSYAAAGAPAGFDTPEIGSAVRGGASRGSRPDWFDEQEFLSAAKTHFIGMQAAWDKGDMQELREYTTPELFAELTTERRQLRDDEPFTEVASLNAELLGLETEGDRVVASVRYSGLIREAHDAGPQAFAEIWHIERSLNEPAANWYVAGIQQDDLPPGPA